MTRETAFFAGRRGVVLGVSGENSIGHTCASTLRDLGGEVAVTYRSARRARCAPLAEAAGFSHHFAIDVGDEDSWAAAFAALDAAWGKIDFVVHTLAHVPGGALSRPLLALRGTELQAAMEVGVHSLIVACRHAAPLLSSVHAFSLSGLRLRRVT